MPSDPTQEEIEAVRAGCDATSCPEGSCPYPSCGCEGDPIDFALATLRAYEAQQARMDHIGNAALAAAREHFGSTPHEGNWTEEEVEQALKPIWLRHEVYEGYNDEVKNERWMLAKRRYIAYCREIADALSRGHPVSGWPAKHIQLRHLLARAAFLRAMGINEATALRAEIHAFLSAPPPTLEHSREDPS